VRISTVSIKADGMPGEILLAPINVDLTTNWLTVVTGENGTRKSLLLRLLAGAALDRPAFKASGHQTAETHISFVGEKPSKIFALSGTPSDRFPVVSGIPVTRAPTTFDVEAYSYFGPRYAGNVATRLRMITAVMHSLLRDPARTSDRARQVLTVLLHLGYSSAIRLSVEPHRKLRIKGDQARAAVLRTMASEIDDKLAMGKESSASLLRGFVSALMTEGPENAAAARLLSKPQTIDIDFRRPSTEDDIKARPMGDIANLLAAGFLVADELSFSRSNANEDAYSVSVDQDWVASNDLSSGQWQLINGLLNLALNVEDNSLVLVDEPENSLHPEWQREYVDLLRLTMSSVKGCHVVLATHSPLIAAGVRPDEGNLLRLLHAGDPKSIEVSPEFPVFGWLPGDVLQERFDMESARAPELVETANSALALLKNPGFDSVQLESLGRTLSRLAAGLPTTDPLLPALEAIVELALPGAQRPE